MKKIACLGMVIVGLAAFGTTSRPVDDAKFILDIRPDQAGAGGGITSTAVGDRLRWSSSAIVTATENGHGGDPIVVTNISFAPNIYPMTTNVTPCLYFPQSDYYDEDGFDHVSSDQLTLNNAAVTSLTQTAFVRFRWDGASCTNFGGHQSWLFLNAYSWNVPADDGANGIGWGLGVANIANNSTSGRLCGLVRHQVTGDMGYTFTVGKWYDLFATITPTAADPTKSAVKVYVIATPGTQTVENRLAFFKPKMSTVSWTPAAVIKTVPSHPHIVLGSEGSYAGYAKVSVGNTGQAKTFRGAIAGLMLWDRLLTQDEMWQVASGYHGSTWAVGAINGSSGEFAASGADEFHVTNSWRFLRRELTAANPSVRLRGPMVAEDAKLGHVLQIAPVEAGMPSPCLVRVEACGTPVGTYDVANASRRVIFIPANFWTRDAKGEVTVTLTRTGTVSGTLALDAVTLSGSWCIGNENGSNDGTHENCVISTYFVGDTLVTTHRMRATGHNSAGYDNQRVWMYLPLWMEGRPYKYTLESKMLGMQSTISGKFQAALYVNGTCLDTITGLSANSPITKVVPPELLTGGMNLFSLSNAVPPSVSGNAWCNYDFFRLRVDDMPRGTYILVK